MKWLIKQDASKDEFIISSEVNMNNKNNHKCPQYTLEFKHDAAKLVNEKGYTHQQAADNLRVSLSAMGRWVRAEQNPTTASPPKKKVLNLTDQEELSR
jgi:transposase